jgi:hypothetical protein
MPPAEKMCRNKPDLPCSKTGHGKSELFQPKIRLFSLPFISYSGRRKTLSNSGTFLGLFSSYEILPT